MGYEIWGMGYALFFLLVKKVKERKPTISFIQIVKGTTKIDLFTIY